MFGNTCVSESTFSPYSKSNLKYSKSNQKSNSRRNTGPYIMLSLKR